MDVQLVDPTDTATLSAYWRVQCAVEEHLRLGEPGTTEVELLEAVREGAAPDADARKDVFVSRDSDGTVVAGIRCDAPLRDNLHLVEAECFVRPDRWRQGHARALLAAAERVLRADGRTTLIGYSDERPDDPGPMVEGAGAALGFTVGQREVRRDIDLPLRPDVVEQVAALVRDKASAYAVVTWVGHAPEQHLDDLALLHQRMSTDVPMGDLEIVEESFDADRVRRHEQRAVDQDRLLLGAGAVERATGRMVAYTDQALPRSLPERAYQWNTIVLHEHRGHALGAAVKLACLQLLHAQSPATRFITTWNAEENDPMIRVNDLLGARVNGTSTAWQKRLG